MSIFNTALLTPSGCKKALHSLGNSCCAEKPRRSGIAASASVSESILRVAFLRTLPIQETPRSARPDRDRRGLIFQKRSGSSSSLRLVGSSTRSGFGLLRYWTKIAARWSRSSSSPPSARCLRRPPMGCRCGLVLHRPRQWGLLVVWRTVEGTAARRVLASSVGLLARWHRLGACAPDSLRLPVIGSGQRVAAASGVVRSIGHG
jgi:hypothetical protein